LKIEEKKKFTIGWSGDYRMLKARWAVVCFFMGQQEVNRGGCYPKIQVEGETDWETTKGGEWGKCGPWK